MPSSVGWLELSASALRRMRQELAGDGEETVDEMGVLALHSGYADLFFPGTSVLHTRPRYLFFVCWNLLHLKKSDISASEYPAAKQAAETWVTEQLRRGGEAFGAMPKGIIGGRIYPQPPAQPPDSIYWTGLRTFGFVRAGDRGALARRWHPSRIRHLEPGANTPDKEEDVSDEPLAQLRVPHAPHFWQKPRPRPLLTFELEKHEAEFLFTRLKSLEKSCLLGQAARQVESMAPVGDDLWLDPLIRAAAQSLGDSQLQQIDRARQASALVELIRAIYAALVEQVCNTTKPRKQADGSENARACQERLLGYWQGDGELLEEARGLDLRAVGEDIPSLVGGPFLALLGHIQARLIDAKSARDVKRCLLDADTELRCARIEARRKGRRARLPRTPAGAERRSGFGPETIAVRGLDYRWPQVRTMLRDLRGGLRR